MAVLLDLDGTLADSRPGIGAQLAVHAYYDGARSGGSSVI